MVAAIQQLLQRDLTALKAEIEQYQHSADMWKINDSINNSAGNLCLHICGNLQHFIGSIIGESGYVRDRANEFGALSGTVDDLIEEINSTEKSLIEALKLVSEAQLQETYPIEVFGQPMTYGYFLVHLSGHLMYHLGQINYHRRLLAS